jgi:5-methylcytosine-specific restriction protein B
MTSESTYDLSRAQSIEQEIVSNADTAERVIRSASEKAVIDYLLKDLDRPIDQVHDGIEFVREALLESSLASLEQKQSIETRGDETKNLDVLVADDVYNNAQAGLSIGKPVVLYGPTGTGKTTLAKKLALETSIGYTLHTASPSWTSQDIIGQVVPNYSDGEITYEKELGAVSEAVKRAEDYDGPYAVILDEITRADISRIFGPLYTAIENPHQTIFTTDDGRSIELNPKVNIICTMNMSDRTVNELDDAITRRFTMIEVSNYTSDARSDLFNGWIDEYLIGTPLESRRQELTELFERDYQLLNHGSEDGTSGITQFGPMHYEDVIQFLGVVCDPDNDGPGGGTYVERSNSAVGQAFATYIVPRLLNTASYPMIEQIRDHYYNLDEQFDVFDLSVAADKAAKHYETRKKQMSQ